MTHILSTNTWVSLTSEQRNRIRALFSIPRSSHTIVSDGRIETDGTTADDFNHLTIEKMKVYLKSDSDDFHKLFDLVLGRVQDEIEGKPFAETIEVINANSIKNEKSKKGSKK